MQRVASLVRLHLRPGALDPAAGEKAWRRLVHAAGSDIDLLLLLSLADTGATGGEEHAARTARMQASARRLRSLFALLGEELTRPRPLVGGREVMAATGLAPGPQVGAILARLLERQVEGEIKTREAALAAIPGLAAQTAPE
jgi:poly(A) polymerase